MLIKTIAFLFAITAFLTANANIKDSITYYLNKKKPELIGGFSARNTFIGSTKTHVNGLSVGYDYGGKISLSAGIYWLPSAKPVTERKIINAFTPSQNMVDEISKFWYLGVSGDYVFYQKGRWTLDVPVRIGLGIASVKQQDTSIFQREISKTHSVIIPLESGIGAQYKIAWWIGFSGGLGSRIVIGKNTSQKFSGTYYSLGVTIFFAEIYNFIKKDMEKNPARKPKRK